MCLIWCGKNLQAPGSLPLNNIPFQFIQGILIFIMFIPPLFITYGINKDNNIKVNFDDSFFLVINVHSIIASFHF